MAGSIAFPTTDRARSASNADRCDPLGTLFGRGFDDRRGSLFDPDADGDAGRSSLAGATQPRPAACAQATRQLMQSSAPSTDPWPSDAGAGSERAPPAASRQPAGHPATRPPIAATVDEFRNLARAIERLRRGRQLGATLGREAVSPEVAAERASPVTAPACATWLDDVRETLQRTTPQRHLRDTMHRDRLAPRRGALPALADRGCDPVLKPGSVIESLAVEGLATLSRRIAGAARKSDVARHETMLGELIERLAALENAARTPRPAITLAQFRAAREERERAVPRSTPGPDAPVVSLRPIVAEPPPATTRRPASIGSGAVGRTGLRANNATEAVAEPICSAAADDAAVRTLSLPFAPAGTTVSPGADSLARPLASPKRREALQSAAPMQSAAGAIPRTAAARPEPCAIGRFKLAPALPNDASFQGALLMSSEIPTARSPVPADRLPPSLTEKNALALADALADAPVTSLIRAAAATTTFPSAANSSITLREPLRLTTAESKRTGNAPRRLWAG